MTDGATWNVRVNVAHSGAGGTTVDLLGPDYKETLYDARSDFSVDFTGVPDGEYDIQVQYGNTTVSGEVTVKGENAETTVDVGL